MLCYNISYKHCHTLVNGCSIKKSVLECTISILSQIRLFDEPQPIHSINDVNKAKNKHKLTAFVLPSPLENSGIFKPGSCADIISRSVNASYLSKGLELSQ